MNNNLPTECLVLIIDHTQDLPTLHSLLTVNWEFFRIAAHAIYRDPIHLAWSQDIAVRKSLSSPNSVTPRYLQALFDFILQVSPAAAATATSIIDGGDDNDLGMMYLRRMRNLEQWQQDKITIDYLGFIEVFDFPSPAGMRVDPVLCHPSTKIMQKKLLLNDMQMKGLIKHTITWAACCHHFETLRRMYMPVCKLDVYLTVIPRLTRLATITFDYTSDDYGHALWKFHNEIRANDSNRQISTTDGNYNSTYVDNSVEPASRVSPTKCTHDFVRAFINHHTANNPSSSPLQDCRVHKHQFWWVGAVDESVQDLLPPLRQPRELAPHNWYRFIKVADTIDLSQVEVIRRSGLDWDEPWLDFQQVWPDMSIGSVLQRCRCLQALEMDHVDEVDFLRWGVEGREKKEEEQQDTIKDERAISQWPLKAPSPSLALLPPLRRLDITCKVRVFEQLINDALTGFGQTLEDVKVKSPFKAQSIVQKPIRLGPNRTAVTAAGGGEARSKRGATRRSWHLPNLRKLVLECRNSPILLEPSALNRCPLIEELVIEGKRTLSPLSSEDGQEQPPYEKLIPVLDTWQMIQLRRLSLKGPVAWSFCPKSLQSMASLTTLLLVTAGGEWATDQSHQSQQSQHDDHHQQLPTPLGDVTMNLEEEIRRWGPIWNSLRLPHLKQAEFIGDVAGVIDVVAFLRCCPELYHLTLNTNPPGQHPGQGAPPLLPLRMQTDLLPVTPTSLQKGTVASSSTVAPSSRRPKGKPLYLSFHGFHISDDQVDHIPLLDKLVMDGHFELEKLNLSSNSGFSSMRLLQACERSDVLMDVVAATIPLSDTDAKLVSLGARNRRLGDFELRRPNGRRFCWYQFEGGTYIRNTMPWITHLQKQRHE